jgi:hypothetical protein
MLQMHEAVNHASAEAAALMNTEALVGSTTRNTKEKEQEEGSGDAVQKQGAQHLVHMYVCTCMVDG